MTTVRLRQLEELVTPLARLEALTEANPDCVLILSGEEVLYANPAAHKLLAELKGGVSPLARQLLLATAANRRSGLPERTTVEGRFAICVHSAGPNLQQVTLRELATHSSLAEGAAHKINNLLTALLGLTVLLEGNLEDASPETRELLAELRSTAQAGVSMVRQQPAPLPLAEAPEEANLPKPWTPARVGQGETILFVDDEQSIRLVGKASLTRAGYRVLTARNGEDALQFYRKHGQEIQLVLLDLDMPVMDGEACFTALRQLSPAPRVVVMSGHAQAPAVTRMLDKGALAFLGKPFGVNELLSTAASLL